MLQDIYPHATAIMLLCDGGGSNSSSSRLFKQRADQTFRRPPY
ncbi:hypothetical protein [Prevotella sp. C561]